MEEKPNYFAVIPANVRYDENLKLGEKMMYGEITSLTQKTGECWASNNYFATLYKVTPQAISKWIKSLEKFNYIKIEYEKDGKSITKRIIKLVSTDIDRVSTGVDRGINHSLGGYQHRIKENNININNTSINNKEIYKESYGEYKNVLLNENELNKLSSTYINYKTLIDFLDEYIESLEPSKKKAYLKKNHYLCIRRWVAEAVEEREKKKLKGVPEWFDKDLNKGDELSDEDREFIRQVQGSN